MNFQIGKRLSIKLPCLALIATALCLVAFACPQDGLPPKPFQQWSKQEANKVLEESAWVRKQEVRIRYAELSRRIAGGSVPSATEGGLTNTTSNTAEMSGAEAPVDFQFTLRLRSAVVV